MSASVDNVRKAADTICATDAYSFSTIDFVDWSGLASGLR